MASVSQIIDIYSNYDLTRDVKRYLEIKGSCKLEQVCLIKPNVESALFVIKVTQEVNKNLESKRKSRYF